MPKKPTPIAAQRAGPTFSPSTGPERAAMISGKEAKIAWVGISPSRTKAATVTQISVMSRRPRAICNTGWLVAAAARSPPALRPATTRTKAAKNQ